MALKAAKGILDMPLIAKTKTELPSAILFIRTIFGKDSWESVVAESLPSLAIDTPSPYIMSLSAKDENGAKHVVTINLPYPLTGESTGSSFMASAITQALEKLSGFKPITFTPTITSVSKDPITSVSKKLYYDGGIAPQQPSKPLFDSSKIVPLKSASFIGQKVLGSTPGSLYRVVAMNGRVKLASKWSANSIHFRIEGEPDISELVAIKKYFTWYEKKKYGSIHFHGLSVPVDRVAGAFIMGLGIEFDQQIKRLAEANQ